MTLARAIGVAVDELEKLVDGTREYVGLLQEVQRVGDIQPGPDRTSRGLGAIDGGGVIGGTASGGGSGIVTGPGSGGQLSSGGGSGGRGLGGGVPEGPVRFGAQPVPPRLGPGDPAVFLANQVLQRLNQLDGTLRGLGAHGLNNRARDRAGSR